MIALNRQEQGFTVAELAISVSIALIVSGIVLTVVIVFYGNLLRGELRSRMVVDSQIILRNLADELRLSAGVLTSNTLTDPNEPSGGWLTSSGAAILIISTPATDNSGEYIWDESTGSFYQNEIIYFAEDDVMYRRVLANSAATGNTATTTCPASVASSMCPADRILTDEYEVMNFIFYDQDNNVTTDPNVARSIDMTINLNRSIYGQPVTTETSIRSTMRN